MSGSLPFFPMKRKVIYMGLIFLGNVCKVIAEVWTLETERRRGMSRESIGLMLDISVRQNKTCRKQFLFPVGLKGVQTATSDTHASTIGICVWSDKSLPSREQFTMSSLGPRDVRPSQKRKALKQVYCQRLLLLAYLPDLFVFQLLFF